MVLGLLAIGVDAVGVGLFGAQSPKEMVATVAVLVIGGYIGVTISDAVMSAWLTN